jgi:hypothetical protein
VGPPARLDSLSTDGGLFVVFWHQRFRSIDATDVRVAGRPRIGQPTGNQAWFESALTR